MTCKGSIKHKEICVEIERPDFICKYLICGRAWDSLDCLWKKRKWALRLSVLHFLRRTQDSVKTKSSSTWLGWAGIKGILNHISKELIWGELSVFAVSVSKHLTLFLNSYCTGRVRNNCCEICPASVVSSEELLWAGRIPFLRQVWELSGGVLTHTPLPHTKQSCALLFLVWLDWMQREGSCWKE